MRFGLLLLIGLLFILGQSPVFAQAEADTLGLTGTMADTVVARALYNAAIEHYKSNKIKTASELSDSSILIWEKYLGKGCSEMADVFNLKGNILDELGELNDAISYYSQALAIQRNQYPDNDHPSIANSFNNLGLAYIKMDELELALDCLNNAIKIRMKWFGERSKPVSETFVNLGILYKAKGDYKKSVEYYFQAIKFYEKTNSINEAILYNNIGNVFRNMGNYNKAIDYQTVASGIFLSNFGEEHPYVAWGWNNIGISYSLLKDNNRAINYHFKSLKIRRKILPENHPDIAASYVNIGMEYDVLENFDSSIYYLNSAIEILGKDGGSYKSKLASCYNNMGLIYNHKKACQLAENNHAAALALRQSAFGLKHPDIALSLKNLGISKGCMKEFEEADSLFNQALKALNVSTSELQDYALIPTVTLLIEILLEKSRIEYEWYNTNIDQKNLVNSQKTVTSVINILSRQYKSNLTVFPDYENIACERYISNSLKLLSSGNDEHYLSSNFALSETAKASRLRTAIAELDALAFAGIPDSLLEQEHKLRIDISWREKQRQGLLDKGLSETDTNVLRIGGIVFDLKQQHEALKKRFETEYPEYYRLKYDLSTVSLSYVQDTLLQKDQALLEYFTSDSSIFLFVVRPDTMIVQEVKRDFPLEDWIEGLRYGIYGYYAAEKAVQTDSLKADAKQQYLEFAPKLYQKLVAPIAQHLPEKVILVPDGPLGYIPFDALLTAAPEDANDFKSYPYLIQQHQFSYSYSATLLREMRNKKHRQEPQKDFVAFAPFYNGDTTLLAGMYSYDDLMRKDLQPLAFSGPEVAAAAKLMRGETVAGAAATEARFTATAGNYRILHLATHGRADNRVGDYAFLAFTEIKDSLENELLYVKDLYNLQLNADLVVLSACETGIGKLQRGEGIISLARAFAYAGAKSIVTSLWSVNDKSTSELMRFFYRELKHGKDKDEALRLARLRFLKESTVKNSHPFFWAAFVPVGDMRGVK